MLDSFKNAIGGLIISFFYERNISIISICTILTICCSIYLEVSKLELAVFIFLCSTVIALELINLSIEKFIDLIHPSKSDKIRFAKDVLAGATLASAISAIAIAYLILLPKIQLLTSRFF